MYTYIKNKLKSQLEQYKQNSKLHLCFPRGKIAFSDRIFPTKKKKNIHSWIFKSVTFFRVCLSASCRTPLKLNISLYYIMYMIILLNGPLLYTYTEWFTKHHVHIFSSSIIQLFKIWFLKLLNDYTQLKTLFSNCWDFLVLWR